MAIFENYNSERELSAKARTVATMLEFANAKEDPTIKKHHKLLTELAETIDCLVDICEEKRECINGLRERVNTLQECLDKTEDDGNTAEGC